MRRLHPAALVILVSLLLLFTLPGSTPRKRSLLIEPGTTWYLAGKFKTRGAGSGASARPDLLQVDLHGDGSFTLASRVDERETFTGTWTRRRRRVILDIDEESARRLEEITAETFGAKIGDEFARFRVRRWEAVLRMANRDGTQRLTMKWKVSGVLLSSALPSGRRSLKGAGKAEGGLRASFAILSWDPPATNADGSPLNDLAGFKVYHGTREDQLSESVDVGDATLHLFTDLPSGTHYFGVTAYDASRNESELSEVVSKTIE